MRRLLSRAVLAFAGAGVTYGFFVYKDFSQSIQQHKIDEPKLNLTQSSQLLAKAAIQPPKQPVKDQTTQQTNNETQIDRSSQLKNEEKEEKEAKQTKQAEEQKKKHFKFLKEVGQFKMEKGVNSKGRVLIVADLPYNQQFEAKVIDQINKIVSTIENVRIYKKDFSNKQEVAKFQKEFKVKIKDQTIFVLQNNYDKRMNNIDFDVFSQYPSLIEYYLKDVSVNDENNISEVISRLSKLSPHQSTLLYLYDKTEPQQKIKERMLAAKYIQMQMVLNNLYGIKLQVVQKNAAVEANLISLQSNRTNSVHLYRKHNIYTPYDPNYYLKINNNQFQPFHRLIDIALFAKDGQSLLIKQYLSNLQTFDAIANPAKFMCTLRVDRNRITDQDYTRLLRIFGELRKKNKFADICYSLKLKKVPYGGRDSLPNKEWMITLTNLDQLDKQSMMHQIKTIEQLEKVDISEKDYLRTTHQYLYQHNVFSEELVIDFLEKASKGQINQYYRSEEENNLKNMRKLVGRQFDQSVLKDQKDHFVYQYSDFCPTCKRISPIISSFSKVVQEKGSSSSYLGLGIPNLQFHRFDANKNRVKRQLSSPYIPNIFYYKNEWKKGGPVRFPIQMLGSQGLISLYSFCAITSELKTLPWSDLDKAIVQSKKFKKEEFSFL